MFQRVLLKFSGEALSAGQAGILDFDKLTAVLRAVKRAVDEGAQVALVCGGGNIWRGAGKRLSRVKADQMGMLATVINAIAIADTLQSLGTPAVVQSALPCAAADPINPAAAVKALESGTVVVFAGGTGNPYFSTDTGAILRGIEIGADAVLMAKNVDGVYDKDPVKFPDTAVRYDELTYEQVIDQKLRATDLTAATLALDNRITLCVFKLDQPDDIYSAVMGRFTGTVIK